MVKLLKIFPIIVFICSYALQLTFDLSSHLCCNQQCIKSKSKGHNEDQKNAYESEERLEDIKEHDDVDAQKRKLSDVAKEV